MAGSNAQSNVTGKMHCVRTMQPRLNNQQMVGEMTSNTLSREEDGLTAWHKLKMISATLEKSGQSLV